MLVRLLDSQAGGPTAVSAWEFDRPKLTLRELLRERVTREVEAFNSNRPEIYRGLVEPEQSERILNGYRVKVLRHLDAEEQYQRAVRAFESNGFFVLAGGRQVESLDEEIDLQSSGEVEFVKLVPLVGG